MIFVDSAWEEVRSAAQEHLLNNRTWSSPVKGREYSVDRVTDKSVYIRRLSGGNVTVLTKANVERMVRKLNAANGRIARRELDYTVAVETAFVHLHPLVIGDEDSVLEIQLEDILATAKQPASTDLKRQLYARNVRRGQAVLRNHLLNIYDGKCCISETGPFNVLEAAHVEAHSISGIDDPSNAILLRADLHNLFDDNLMGIHPSTLAVHIDPSLKGTIYESYHLKCLQPRKDRSVIDAAKLKKRWHGFNQKE